LSKWFSLSGNVMNLSKPTTNSSLTKCWNSLKLCLMKS
jgi:hypothetical protein